MYLHRHTKIHRETYRKLNKPRSPHAGRCIYPDNSTQTYIYTGRISNTHTNSQANRTCKETMKPGSKTPPPPALQGRPQGGRGVVRRAMAIKENKRHNQ